MPSKPKLRYEVITPPQPGFQNRAGRPIMLAACGGGPGMASGYLHPLVAAYPSLGLDWARVDTEGVPLRRRDIALDAQATYIEACRQQASAELGNDIQLIPVCHSAAGPRGVLWAARYPKHAAGLVLVDAVMGPSRLPYSPIWLLLRLLVYRLRHPGAGWEEAFRARFMPLVGHYYFVHPTAEQQAAFTGAFISPFWQLLLHSGLGKWDVREPLRALQVPVLIMHGESDQIIPPASAEREVEALGGRAQLCLIPGAGHLPMLERPLASAEVLRAFVESVGVQECLPPAQTCNRRV